PRLPSRSHAPEDCASPTKPLRGSPRNGTPNFSCPGWDSNPHAPVGTRAFKAPMSTCSITRAGRNESRRRSDDGGCAGLPRRPCGYPAIVGAQLRRCYVVSVVGRPVRPPMEAGALHPPAGGLTAIAGRSPLLRLQTDERLIALIRKGHHGAFEALVQRYPSRLL